MARAQTYSQYKKGNTVKLLVSCNPYGTIRYVLKAPKWQKKSSKDETISTLVMRDVHNIVPPTKADKKCLALKVGVSAEGVSSMCIHFSQCFFYKIQVFKCKRQRQRKNFKEKEYTKTGRYFWITQIRWWICYIYWKKQCTNNVWLSILINVIVSLSVCFYVC